MWFDLFVVDMGYRKMKPARWNLLDRIRMALSVIVTTGLTVTTALTATTTICLSCRSCRVVAVVVVVAIIRGIQGNIFRVRFSGFDGNQWH